MLYPEILVRILVGTLLGGVIGYERDRHGKPAGLRTHMLVALASASFMAISTKFVFWQGYTHDQMVEVDTSRIAASIVSGIGFLAGGAIFRTGATVQGLTTAAGLWLVAAIGMAAGAGMFMTAVYVTILGVAVLTILRRFEDKDDSVVQRRMSVVIGDEGTAQSVLDVLSRAGVRAAAVDYDRHVEDKRLDLTLDLQIQRTLPEQRILDDIAAQPGVRRIRLHSV